MSRQDLHRSTFHSLPSTFSAQPRPSGATGRHATLRTSCPLWAWEFNSPLGHFIAGGAGARPAFIRPASRIDTGACNFQISAPVGQRPAKPHTLRRPGATPEPAICLRVCSTCLEWSRAHSEVQHFFMPVLNYPTTIERKDCRVVADRVTKVVPVFHEDSKFGDYGEVAAPSDDDILGGSSSLKDV